MQITLQRPYGLEVMPGELLCPTRKSLEVPALCLKLDECAAGGTIFPAE